MLRYSLMAFARPSASEISARSLSSELPTVSSCHHSQSLLSENSFHDSQIALIYSALNPSAKHFGSNSVNHVRSR
jgi:hypothetical protein